MRTAPRHLKGSPGLVFIPGLIYESFVRLRNYFYDSRLLAQRRLPHPVLSIGNLTMGGSGKTPLAILMAQIIVRMGKTPVLLSRGYGRTGKGLLIMHPWDQVPLPAQVLGDEPALIRRHVPEVWLGICPDRYAVGLQIGQHVPDPVFILDDGFQHRRLGRDLDIVIIDRTQPTMQNRVLPRGTLREPLTSLRRAGVSMINGAWGGPGTDPVEDSVRSFNRHARIYHCIQKIDRIVEFSRWRTAGTVAPRANTPNAFLAAAIGNPGRFRKDVREFGVEIMGQRFYRDHYRLSFGDWRACAEAARRCGAAALLTTEKDAIKIADGPDLPLFVAVQSMSLSEQPEMERTIQSIIGGQN